MFLLGVRVTEKEKITETSTSTSLMLSSLLMLSTFFVGIAQTDQSQFLLSLHNISIEAVAVVHISCGVATSTSVGSVALIRSATHLIFPW